MATDSAGIRIVRLSSVRDVPATFRLGPVLARLGERSEDPARELNARQPFLDVLFLSDGGYAVPDWDQIKVYSSDGRLRWASGGRGLGPGEFSQIMRLCAGTADSLIAIDYSDRRLSLWSPAGTWVRSWTALPGVMPSPCFSDGTLLAIRMGRTDSADARGHMRFVQVERSGHVLREIGWFPRERYGPVPAFTTVSAHGDEVLVADGVSFVVDVYGNDGRLRRALRIGGRGEGLSPGAASDSLAALRLRVPVGVRLPDYARMFLDSERRLWVQAFLRHHLWLAFAPDMTPIGGVLVAPPTGMMRARLLGVSSGRAAVLYISAEGDATIWIHRLEQVR